LTKEEKEVQIHEKQNRLHQTFLQAKTFTKNCLRHFLLREKKYFFGKVFKTF